MTKREQLMDAALTLFSEKGYDGVGVDEIAESIGMQGPGMYYYFKGKSALLDALLDYVKEYYGLHFAVDREKTIFPADWKEFEEITMQRLEFTIHDSIICRTRRMLSIEQFRNERMRALTTLHHITIIEGINIAIFTHFIEQGLMKKEDPELLAFAFTSPITMMVHWIDREPEKEAVAMQRIRDHMALFAKTYMITDPSVG